MAADLCGKTERLKPSYSITDAGQELIAPASPQQNGRHERMHRTLKAEATRPPSGNLRAQQVRFNRFRHEYNDDRLHEALDQETPASIYRPSERALPRQLASEVTRVFIVVVDIYSPPLLTG
jgi:hypothetical protein